MKLLFQSRFPSSIWRHADAGRLVYNDRVEAIRKTEYPMLKGTTYLDHAGTALPSRSFIEMFSQEIQSYLIANPHSASAKTPSTSQVIVQNTRKEVLELFNASPEHFEVVFVANATAGIKLVLEAFHGHEQGFDYYYHRDSHTSLVGVRELSATSHCLLSDEETEDWIANGEHDGLENANERPALFAYPAQSNMNGRRLPLNWSSRLRSSGRHPQTYTLLDIAALVSTSPLDLSDHDTAPDFLTLSFYKTFGSPDLGALIVRKSAAHVFDKRRYFGGGTTELITCDQPWFARKEGSLSARLEDGTGATHSILALSCAIHVHKDMYGGLSEISKHTGWLAKDLYERLSRLRHFNGGQVCVIYKDPSSIYGDATTQGGTVAFNIVNSRGTWVSASKVGNLAAERNIHVRSGGLCNPAGMAQMLGHRSEDLRRAYDSGFRCGQADDVRIGMAFGMVRASFGACSTLKDVEIFAQFIEDYFVEKSGGISDWEAHGHVDLGVHQNAHHESCGRPLDSIPNWLSFQKLSAAPLSKGKRFWRRLGSGFPSHSKA
ncbi:PLP-dependent transferase [Corynespora cassiicola Philippines]|uniref:PLP-dependent transferase n=1 Tax=Corynespora cassiicola Philippines TaxID=1448308 RepID=A0A2T2N8I8_CORCC|nr:PLP-dependent transferase [Corynespora cassiicola Philippines]